MDIQSTISNLQQIATIIESAKSIYSQINQTVSDIKAAETALAAIQLNKTNVKKLVADIKASGVSLQDVEFKLLGRAVTVVGSSGIPFPLYKRADVINALQPLMDKDITATTVEATKKSQLAALKVQAKDLGLSSSSFDKSIKETASSTSRYAIISNDGFVLNVTNSSGGPASGGSSSNNSNNNNSGSTGSSGNNSGSTNGPNGSSGGSGSSSGGSSGPAQFEMYIGRFGVSSQLSEIAYSYNSGRVRIFTTGEVASFNFYLGENLLFSSTGVTPDVITNPVTGGAVYYYQIPYSSEVLSPSDGNQEFIYTVNAMDSSSVLGSKQVKFFLV